MRNERSARPGMGELRRSVLYAAAFVVLLLLFELVVLFPQREVDVVRKHLAAASYSRLVASVLLSMASMAASGLFVWAALQSSWRYRVLYAASFFVLTAFEYATHSAFGGFSNFSLAMTAIFAGDPKIIVYAVTEYFVILSFVPTFAFLLLLVVARPPVHGGGLRLLVMMFIATALFFAASAYVARNQYYTTSLSAAARTAVGFPTLWFLGSIRGAPVQKEYRAPRLEVAFRSDQRPVNNVVLIIDESVRGDHLSLNGYPLPTTRILEPLAERNLIKNWGIAVSGSTCSLESNNLLLTGGRSEPGVGGLIYRLPTIFQFARAMNYKTHHFDGQTSALWLGKPQDRNFVDHYVAADELMSVVGKKRDVDAEIAKRVNQITSSSIGNFIWINKVGVHKPYTDAYPDDGGPVANDVWGPAYNPSITRDDLVQAYDSGITYNAQSFFSALFTEITVDVNTIYIYTSDHGQTLQENGSMVSHCSDTKPEANVPLFMIADPRSLPEIDTGFKASHANIFPTLLDLMRVPETARQYEYANSLITATAADSTRRFYVAGNTDAEVRLAPFD
ncbi:MAG TPA: sulfatase-like hydrolase/transferase [Pyrinomonadaceae bacterium]|nr:sulfatase-like hydrolase/transferase [Pyrinomonadaceae bacterium]